MMSDVDTLANSCIECGQQWDDHTVAAFREHWAAAHPAVDLPYAPIEPGTAQAVEVAMADFVTVAASVIPTPPAAQLGGMPSHLAALVFTFSQGAKPFPPMALVLTDIGMRQLRTLLGDAIDASLKATRKVRKP